MSITVSIAKTGADFLNDLELTEFFILEKIGKQKMNNFKITSKGDHKYTITSN
jgi:hypothetical protein